MGLVEDLQLYLQQEGVVDGSTEWPSVRRRVHDGSDKLVILTEDGGSTERPSASGIGDSAMRNPQVQIRVRGEPWDGDSAEAQIKAIEAVLHGASPGVIGYTVYKRLGALTEPIFMGFDTKNRPEFAQSYRATTDVTAPA